MNETKSLLNKYDEESNVCGGNKETQKPWFGIGALSISLVGVGILLGSSLDRLSSPNTIESPPPPPPSDDVPPSTTRNRPLCRTYGDNARFTGILQTSMGSPSEQWSHIPCYAQPKKTWLWAGQENSADAAGINSFGAADAIFRVNFTRPAFPERQPILGFGGAFTDASALNYQSLSDSGKERLMELLFGETGIGYSLGRFQLNLDRVVSIRCTIFCSTIEPIALI